MKTRLTLSIALLCAAAPSFVQAETLPVTEDVTVISTTPDTNWGANNQVRADVTREGYLKYDLSSISGLSGSNILDAKLRVYVSTVDVAGNFEIYEAAGSWGEATVTWNNAPGTTGSALDVGIFSSATLNTFVELDITSVVQGWANGNTNNGLVMVPQGSTVVGRIAARENSSGWPPSEIVVTTDQAGPADGKAYIPAFRTFQAGTSALYFIDQLMVSNITSTRTIEVSITLYRADGTVIRDNNVAGSGGFIGSGNISNYEEPTTGPSIRFELGPKQIGALGTNANVLTNINIGWGEIEYRFLNVGSSEKGLVAGMNQAFFRLTNAPQNDAFNAIPINGGNPF